MLALAAGNSYIHAMSAPNQFISGQTIIPSRVFPQPEFLPMSRPEMKALGWPELDILLLSGDAYVDHPACGAALLGRFLVAHGFRVGLLTQPDWRDPASVSKLGRPRLFAGVTSGSMDSMLAHYTAFRKKRSEDAYTPGGRAGARPNRACIVYANLVRQAFPGLPVVLGGIEASLRRVSHYDFWADSLRRSLLLDAKADYLIYGMGETPILSLARLLREGGAGTPAVGRIPGLVRAVSAETAEALAPDALLLSSHEDIAANPELLLKATLDLERQVLQGGPPALQASAGRWVLVHSPAPVLSRAEMDFLYGLPFTRRSHPVYKAPVPAEEMLRTSLTTHRGCASGCTFCSLALHQGRAIAARGRSSILEEAGRLAVTHKSRRGRGLAISDAGGPTGNMWASRCAGNAASCKRGSCLWPEICPQFQTNQAENIALLRELAALPGVSQVRMASGIRYDLGLIEPEALAAYVREFTGGQLKVAPEHISDNVLRLMRKPGRGKLEAFLELFAGVGGNKEQYVIPYLMSAFPGCTDADMREMAVWLKKRGWRPQQVQCFIPTPGTVATAMFYCAKDSRGRGINVARTDAQRLRQHRILTGESEE